MQKIFLPLFFLSICAFMQAQQIPFQGKLLENGTPISGNRNFTLSINQGSINWSETQSNIPVVNGLYNLILGSVTPLPKDLFNDSQSVTLGVSVNGQALSDVVIFLPFGVRWKADGASNVYFEEGNVSVGTISGEYRLNVGGDILFNNGALISNSAGIGSTNIDHLWHKDDNDGIYAGTWYFISDSQFKTEEAFKSLIKAGGIQLLNTSGNSFTLGNFGIGSSNLSQRLTVAGGVQLGNTSINTTGTIRFNNNTFEGYNGSSWLSLSGSSVSTENFTVGTSETSVLTSLQQLNATGTNSKGSIWQSFSLTETVKLSSVEVDFANISNANIRFRIYPDEGINQQALFSEDYSSADFGASIGLKTFNVNAFADITLEAGQTYTFFVQGLGADLTFRENTNNPYPYGRIDYNSATDAIFKINVERTNDFNFQVTENGANVEKDLKVGGRVEDGNGFVTPVGSVMPFAGSSVPKGWLLCDGRTIRRDLYADLFAVIGINWGRGDGSTTFHLPDLRGEFLRGVDGSANEDPDKSSRTAKYAGGSTGNSVGSYQEDEFKSHSHGVENTNLNVLGEGLDFKAFVADENNNVSVSNSFNGNNPISESGGSETRPKNAYVNYIIKY
ncbi:MAG: phage tail protein [Bacteroidota bacterium]